jgi:lipopolysaccharide/colanic/teichoic acid biosynthesis glycosyltransferase
MIDIGIAFLFLPLLSPLFLLISLAIVLESPGNPFYGGWRVGKDGKRFRMWKFRTMVRGADRLGTMVTTRHDSRITLVGWFLRKTKLDELPQFFNLLLGDVTLIGPRPELPAIVEQYTPEQKQIFRVKPGITGPVQLHYTVLEAKMIPDDKNADQFYIEHVLDGKLRLDLEYLNNRTFLSDCCVVLQTMLLMARSLSPTNER